MDTLTLALPIFGILMVAEAIISKIKQNQVYSPKDFMGSMSQLAMNILIKLLIDSVIIGFHFFLYQFRIFDLNLGVINWLITLLALDFTFYWYHRASHRSRILWCAHVVHHSSKYLNLGTALRQSPTGPFTRALFYWPLPLLGFHPLVIAGAGAIATIYGFWTHTQLIDKLWKPLEFVFVTPSHHRVHHGSNLEYVDKNYANLLIIWDRIFGTFAEEKRPIQYGLIKNIETFNPLKIAFTEWVKLVKTIVAAKSKITIWRYCLEPPNTLR